MVIKTALKYLVVCICMLPSTGMRAQDSDYTPLSGYYDFLAVRDIELSTEEVLVYGQLTPWTSGGLHAGVVGLHFNLFNCDDIPKPIILPENPSFIYTVKDLEGNIVARNEVSLESQFGSLRFVKKFSRKCTTGLLVKRGGKYTITLEITPELYSYETEITLVDEPKMHVFDITTTVDTPLCPKVVMSSAYPYNSADFSGKKHLHWTLASGDSPDEIIAEKDEYFELKSEISDLAAVDSLTLTVANLNPGNYLYTLTSDFVPANYSFTASVHDVLDPEITLDRVSYTVGESKEAIVKVDMSYGYPYVGAYSLSDEPTVTICADLLGEETSVSYSDEAWADSDMHCMAEVKIPLEKVTAEAVTENRGELPLHLSILFNGTTKYETALSLHFDCDSSGIHGINTDYSDKSKVRYFNILGVEVDESYRGLVITSDGRKIVR